MGTDIYRKAIRRNMNAEMASFASVIICTVVYSIAIVLANRKSKDE